MAATTEETDRVTMDYRIGDVFDRLAGIPDASVDLIVTSPPFLALRSYLPADHPDKHREIGSEATPADFLDTLLALTAEWGRVLAPHGSLCVELGDTYSGSGGAGGDYNAGGMRDGQPKFRSSGWHRSGNEAPERYRSSGAAFTAPNGGPGCWPLAKSLTGIPTLYPWSLAYGRNLLTGREHDAGLWRIRNLIAWARPNPPVGALGDKFRPATSYITVACRGKERYFDLDAVRTEGSPNTHARLARGADPRPVTGKKADNPHNNFGSMDEVETTGAPPLDWHADDHPEDGDWLWKLSTAPYKGSHYATFPLALPTRLIEAMCPLRVCRVCGRPSERIVHAPTGLHDRHPEFAAMLRAHRERLGLSQRDVDEHFGYNGMCSHWERAIRSEKSQPAYPTAEQWGELRGLLGIATDEFDDLIQGFRRWSDRAMSDEYRKQIERTRAEGFYVSGGNDGMARSGVNGSSMASQHVTLGWSDCGHGDWRTGIVLDPFAGTGTTLAAAQGVGRHAIGIDLDPANADLARERVGMFLTVDEGAA